MPPDNPYSTARTPDFNPYTEPELSYPDTRQQRGGGGGLGTGIVRGIVGSLIRMRQQSRLDEERARQNALQFLGTIPDTDQNTPLKASLALEIMNSKPGKSSWVDRIFGGQNATRDYVADIYSKVRSRLPQPMPLEEGETALVGQDPSGGMVDARPRIATRPRIFGDEESTSQTQGTIQETTVGTPEGRILPARPRPPVLDSGPGKFEFPEYGKFQTQNQVYQDDKGNRFLMQIDPRTGQSRRINLGAVRTSQEIIEEMRGKAKTETLRVAMAKGAMKTVLEAALRDGYDPVQFHSLPIEVQAQYYRAAGVQISENTRLGRDLKNSQIDLNEAKTRESGAREEYLNTLSSTGGIPPGQILSDARAREQQARNYKDEFDALNRESETARRELEALKSATGAMALMNKYDPAYQQRVALLEANYKSKLEAAQVKARQAESLFPGLLKGIIFDSGATEIRMTPPSTMTPQGSRLARPAPSRSFPEPGAPGGETIDARDEEPPPVSALPPPPRRPRRVASTTR